MAAIARARHRADRPRGREPLPVPRDGRARRTSRPSEAIEQIDIGGPSMLRSAAKNFDAVYVVVDPADYARVLDALRRRATPTRARRCAARSPRRCSRTPRRTTRRSPPGSPRRRDDRFPERLSLAFERAQSLRYGENPDQQAAFYVERAGAGLGALVQRGGKELSFNNLLDLEGALLAVEPFGDARPAARSSSTPRPCGLAVGATRAGGVREGARLRPRQRVRVGDRLHGAGGRRGGGAVAELFVECIVAPAVQRRRRRDPRPQEEPARARGRRDRGPARARLQARARRLAGAGAAARADRRRGWQVVTERQPTAEELADLRFAWRAVASVKSNAIVLARDGAHARHRRRARCRAWTSSFLAAHKAPLGRARPDGRGAGLRRVLPLPRRRGPGGGGRASARSSSRAARCATPR